MGVGHGTKGQARIATAPDIPVVFPYETAGATLNPGGALSQFMNATESIGRAM